MQKGINTQKKLLHRRYLIAAVIASLLIMSILILIVLTQTQKPDPASEKIIREAAASQLGMDPNELNSEDFAKIIELTIGERTQTIVSMFDNASSIKYAENKFTDIRMLKKFTNLQTLCLGSIDVPEKIIPNWMKILAKLGIYDIEKRFAIDLTPLKNLHSLETLQLGGPAIVNIKPLAGLNLKNLQLISASIPDLEPVKSLSHLEKIDIIFCPKIKYEDIEDLNKALPNLHITTTVYPTIQ